MECKYVYVQTKNDEFHFHDVKIDSCNKFLTIYDGRNVLEFRCPIDEIINFIREE